MTTLRGVLHLNDVFGNQYELHVSENQDTSLDYRLTDWGRTPYSLSNLQLKKPLPNFAPDDIDALFLELKKKIHAGTYTVRYIERARATK